MGNKMVNKSGAEDGMVNGKYKGFPPTYSTFGSDFLFNIEGVGWLTFSSAFKDIISEPLKYKSVFQSFLLPVVLTNERTILYSHETTKFSKKIECVCFGAIHGFVKLENGEIFGFGKESDALGSSKTREKNGTIKLELNFKSLNEEDRKIENIAFIVCGVRQSYILQKTGNVIAIGSLIKKKDEYFEMGRVPFPVKIKCIASGGSHLAAISFDDNLYLFGKETISMFTKNYENPGIVEFPEQSNVKSCFNVSCATGYTIVSTDSGVFLLCDKIPIVMNKSDKNAPFHTFNNFYKVSSLLPHQINRIISNIYSSVIISNENEFEIVTFEQMDFFINKILKHADGKKIDFPICPTTLFVAWTKESHKNWPKEFKTKVVTFFLICKSNSHKVKVPKIIQIEIIKYFSKVF